MEPYIILPTEVHSHTIIFLHGRDSIATEFAEEFFESQASDDRTFIEIFPNIRWVFPKSRLRSSARYETQMSQWFDMWSVENPLERKDDQREGLMESVHEILEVIRIETEHVPLNRIVLAGISQGCATAVYALIHSEIQVGAFIGLSSWLPFSDELTNNTEKLKGEGELSEEGLMLKTPIFLSHSKDDEVVPIKNGRVLRHTLGLLGYTNLEWKEYKDGGHWINEPEGVDDITAFLHRNLVSI